MTAIAATVGDAVLALSGISKRFGTSVALDDVSFAVRRGTVHALVGENGAGKTTLMRVAFGLMSPDSGMITTGDAVRTNWSAAAAIQSGIGMVHQHFTNVPAMTVAENVALGGRGAFSAAAAARRVDEIGARTGLTLEPAAHVAELPVGAQQRLEIVKALARDARLLILDEPTAVLAPSESEELLRWLRGFANAGNAVVLITHKLREALAVGDDVTVLRRGRVVLSRAARGLSTTALAASMLGEELAERPQARSLSSGAVVASADDVTIIDERGVAAVRNASLEIRSGEILGIAAIEGAGQRELLRALAGRAPVASGRLVLPKSIGFVPEDRHRDALALDLSLTENIALKGAGARRGLMRWRSSRERTRMLVQEYDVRGGDDLTPARALSGGNQQKLVLARELDERPALLVAENPTRGLDIRATAAVHERLRAAAALGTGVVVYSSDLDEVLSLADRVLVVHAGRVRECSRDRDAIGRAMLGVA